MRGSLVAASARRPRRGGSLSRRCRATFSPRRRHLDQPGAGGERRASWSRLVDAGGSRSRTARPRVRRRARRGAEQRPRTRPRSSCSACGRNSKIPPPPLLTTTIRTGASACAQRGEAADVVQQAEVAGDDHGRPPARAAAPIPEETSPSIPLAPRLARKSDLGVGARQEGLLVADRHARGGVDELAVRVGAAERRAAGPGSVGRSSASSSAAIARARRPCRVEPGVGPAGLGRRSASASGERAAPGRPPRRGRSRRRSGSARSSRGAGSTTSCGTSSSVGQPLAQRLAGRHLAEAEHQVGRQRVGPRAGDRLVGADHQRAVVGAEAQLRGRLGEDREAGGAREPRDRRRRARVAQPAGERSRRGASLDPLGERRDERARAGGAGAGGTVVSGRPSSRPSRASGRVGGDVARARLGAERVAPGDVEVHRPGARVAGRGPEGAAGDRAEVQQARRRRRRGCRPRRTSAPRSRRA